jgi:hypothetical protein
MIDTDPPREWAGWEPGTREGVQKSAEKGGMIENLISLLKDDLQIKPF